MKSSCYLSFALFILLAHVSLAQSDTLLLNQSMLIGNVSRTYHLFLPKNPAGAPVVMLFHGHNNTHNGLIELDPGGVKDSSIVAPYKIWLEIAVSENLILAIPNGYNSGDSTKGWNDCRADAQGNSEEDDVLFISRLIDEVLTSYQADSSRIYANGTSNGGHFCIRLAEEIPEKLAAFGAVVASNAVNSECVQGKLPVAALFINGTDDPLCPYTGGPMPGNRGVVLSTDSTLSYWINRNGAQTQPVVTPIANSFSADNCSLTKYEYPAAPTGADVVLYKILDGGHTDPSAQERYSFPAVPLILGKQNGDVEMAEIVWDFFKNKTLPLTSSPHLSDQKRINIYPNPAKASFILQGEFSNIKCRSLTLFNSVGKIARSYPSHSRSYDVAGLPSGMYYLQIVLEDVFLIRKLMIN